LLYISTLLRKDIPIYYVKFLSTFYHPKTNRRPAAKAILEPYENREWRSGLVGNCLYHRDIAFVKRAALHSTKCADTEGCTDDLLYDVAFQPIHGRSSPNREHTTTACADRQLL